MLRTLSNRVSKIFWAYLLSIDIITEVVTKEKYVWEAGDLFSFHMSTK